MCRKYKEYKCFTINFLAPESIRPGLQTDIGIAGGIPRDFLRTPDFPFENFGDFRNFRKRPGFSGVEIGPRGACRSHRKSGSSHKDQLVPQCEDTSEKGTERKIKVQTEEDVREAISEN